MVTITHYEVYSQSSSTWRLEERFPADQRDRAFELRKKLEKRNIPVRIIRESFDVESNRYMESVEYVSGSAAKNISAIAKKKKAAANNKKIKKKIVTNKISKKESRPVGRQNIAGALVTLIAIIIFCLVFANLFVTLLTPLIEEFVPEDKQEITLSVLFFCLFLLTAIPLVVRKVPWHVFDASGFDAPVTERRIYSYADNLVKRYRLNDDIDPSIAPITPEAPLAYKRYIVEFLGQVINNLENRDKIGSGYSKLGIKFLIFGGCLELSRKANLSLTEANSLLYEAFQIMDGDGVDLEGFYEAKRAYNENNAAMFLTGVGAYMVARLLKERPFNPDVLRKAFKRWEDQDVDANNPDKIKPASASPYMSQPFECAVNLLSSIEREDEFDEIGEDVVHQVKAMVEDVVRRLGSKFEGRDVSMFENIYSLKFSSLANAFDFSIRFFREFDALTEDINDENVVFDNRINILAYPDLFGEDAREIILDVFDNSYNEEILVKDEVKEKLEKTEYKFDYLGEKALRRSAKVFSLYKLIYQ